MAGFCYGGAELDELWAKYRATGDIELRNQLAEHYCHLARMAASQLLGTFSSRVDLDDLTSDAYLGLLDAIKRYNPDHGVSFETFAYPRIRGAVIDGIRAMDEAGRRIRQVQRAYYRAIAEIFEREGRPATEQELADALQTNVSQLKRWQVELRTTGHSQSLESMALVDERGEAQEDYTEALADTTVDFDLDAQVHDLAVALANNISQLSERDRILLAVRYCEGLSEQQAADLLGVTQSRICQLRVKALRKLAHGVAPPAPQAASKRRTADPGLPARRNSSAAS